MAVDPYSLSRSRCWPKVGTQKSQATCFGFVGNLGPLNFLLSLPLTIEAHKPKPKKKAVRTLVFRSPQLAGWNWSSFLNKEYIFKSCLFHSGMFAYQRVYLEIAEPSSKLPQKGLYTWPLLFLVEGLPILTPIKSQNCIYTCRLAIVFYTK